MVKTIMKKLDKPIVLIGMMGTGKSVIGQKLARTLSMDFVDTDKIIEERAGMAISDIFEVFGEDKFRSSEKNTIRDSLSQKNVVISTGGGAILNTQTRELLENNAITIWLNAEIQTLVDRVKNDKNRPLLNGQNLKKRLTELLNEREAFYEIAHMHISTDKKSPDKIVNNIIQELESKLIITS